jgi:uncharacterized protein YlxW (UPF0749 family)
VESGPDTRILFFCNYQDFNYLRPMFRFRVDHYHHQGDDNTGQIIKHLNKIMSDIATLQASVDGLNEKVNTLQATVDAEQAQIAQLLNLNASVVQSLNDQIAALQAQLASAPTPEQIQGVIESLEGTKASIEAATADIAGTILDEPNGDNGGESPEGEAPTEEGTV